MSNDLTLFSEREAKSETLTIRLTAQQKNRINQMAQRKGMSVSRFLLSLIAQEHERQTNTQLASFFDDE